MLEVGCWRLDVGGWMLEVGCWRLDVGGWMLDVGCSVFTISFQNTTYLSRRPPGGLGVPWYHSGTVLYP